MWEQSPIGPIADLMWATPEGERRLVAPDEDVAGFVSAVYRFDTVIITPLQAAATTRTFGLDAPEVGLSIRAVATRGWPVPVVGPAWVTRYLAAPVARWALGVRTYGVSPTGVREWYRARWYRPLAEAEASLGGHDLGEMRPLVPPVRFGFSEPPRRPSMVTVRPLLHDPSGRLGLSPREAG